MVGYTVGNLVLWRRTSGAVKHDFQTYIRQYNPQMKISAVLSGYGALQAARHPTKCDIVNDVKLFLTVYRRIYCRNFFDVI